MNNELQQYLKRALAKLEKAETAIIKTNVFDRDQVKARILLEMIKEQMKNENISTPARPTR